MCSSDLVARLAGRIGDDFGVRVARFGKARSGAAGLAGEEYEAVVILAEALDEALSDESGCSGDRDFHRWAGGRVLGECESLL